MGTWPRQFRIQPHNCLSHVTRAEGFWFGLNTETGEDQRDCLAQRITHCSIHATWWSEPYRRRFKNVLILFTVYRNIVYYCVPDADTSLCLLFCVFGVLGVLVFFLNITCTAATALEYNRLISSEQMGKVFLLWGVRGAVFKSPSCIFCLVGVLHNLWRIQAVSVCSIPANVTYHSE